MNRWLRYHIIALSLVVILTAGCSIPKRDEDTRRSQTQTADANQALTLNAPTSDGQPPNATLPSAIVTATQSDVTPVLFGPTAYPTLQADAVVDTVSLRLRSGPGTNYDIIDTMSEGARLTVTGKNGNFAADSPDLWLRVATTNGAIGWTAGWLVALNVNLFNVPVVATPAPPVTATPTPTATPTGPIINFWADNTNLPPGTCTMLHWETENIREIYLDGFGVTGRESRVMCPSSTQLYTLRVVLQDGSVQNHEVTIFVGNTPLISFRADRTQVGPGECTTIRWDVEGVQAVFFQGAGVVGHSEAFVCPGGTTEYHLQVIAQDGVTTYDRSLTIEVRQP
jgi:uncharacterized protein YraI